MNDLSVIGFSDLVQMAKSMANSGMFGKNPDQMLSLMMIAQAEGLHPALAAMEYDIIQGRPALKGQAALARFQQSGGCVNWLVKTDGEAKATFSHPQGGSLTVSWDVSRAKKAGLWDKRGANGQETPWQKMPGIMLSWRCVAEGVRAVYPACLNRMYLAEEVQDFEPLKNITPHQEPEQIVKIAENPVFIKTAPNPDLVKKAAELTAKAGLDKEEKSAMWKDCGEDLEVYISTLESLLNAPAPVDISGIILALEEFERSESCPEAAKKDIRQAFESKESDPVKLSELLERVKTAS